MSLEDKTQDDKPKPRQGGLMTVLRQLEIHNVPVRVQGELRKLILEYHEVYAKTYHELMDKHPRMTEGALHAVTAIHAEKAFGAYLEKKYHG